jgi:hypothetical protein
VLGGEGTQIRKGAVRLHINWVMTGRRGTGERVQDVWRLAGFLLGENRALEDRESHGIETLRAHRLLSRAAERLHDRVAGDWTPRDTRRRPAEGYSSLLDEVVGPLVDLTQESQRANRAVFRPTVPQARTA